MGDSRLTTIQLDRALRPVLRADGFEFGEGNDRNDGEEIGLEAFRKELSACSTALELHCVAANLNWDLGYGGLRAVLGHPLRDRGTALLLYWLGAPTYVPEDPESDWNGEPREFLDGVASRYMGGGFPSSVIRTDPANIFGEDYRFKGEGTVPAEMMEPSPGSSADDLMVYLRLYAALAWFDAGAFGPSELAACEVCLRPGIVFGPERGRTMRELLRRVRTTDGSPASVKALRAFLVEALTGSPTDRP